MKRDQQICFSKGNLSDAIDQRTAQAQKKFYKKNEQKLIFLFLLKIKIEIWNSFFHFVMKVKNEKKKKKNSIINFISKQKSNIPFDPRIHFVHLFFLLLNRNEKRIFAHFWFSNWDRNLNFKRLLFVLKIANLTIFSLNLLKY